MFLANHQDKTDPKNIRKAPAKPMPPIKVYWSSMTLRTLEKQPFDKIKILEINKYYSQ